MRRPAGTLLLLLGTISSRGWGQTSRQGDSTVVPALERRSQAAYDSTAGRWGGFVFTSQNLTGQPGAYGTDVRASYLQSAPVRLVVEQWTPEGKYGAEYYLADGEPYLIFETFERHQEAAGVAWRNFKGFGGWEQRVYLVGREIRYVTTQGTGAPVASADGVRAVAGRLLDALRARRRP